LRNGSRRDRQPRLKRLGPSSHPEALALGHAGSNLLPVRSSLNLTFKPLAGFQAVAGIWGNKSLHAATELTHEAYCGKYDRSRVIVHKR